MAPPMLHFLLKSPSAIDTKNNCTSDPGLRLETRLMLQMSGMHLTPKTEAAVCFIEVE